MPFTSTLFCCTLAAVLAPQSLANQGFLAASSDVVNRDRVVDQLRSLLGHGQNRARMDAIEGLLRPTYMALPKDSRGSLEHRVARYALYRYFLVEHGWHIKGLSLDVEEKGTVSATDMLKSRMPNFIIDMLEQQMGSDRLGLQELAVLAATIEDLVHSDAVDLLELAYKTHGYSTASSLEPAEADFVLRTFVLYFLLPSTQPLSANVSRITSLVTKDASRFYPGWDSTMLWVDDVKEGLEYQDRSALRPFAAGEGHRLEFSSVARWATTISAEFGRFSDLECKEMKNKMLDLEEVEREDGRVGLSKFYAPYLAGGSFHFSESPAYLRHLGALDEHNPKKPNVIVPNVMYAKSNCMATSGFHSVCCIDHCEVLMSDLEQLVFEPTAAPGKIADVVSSMSSDTVAAPRNLSAPMLSRLDEIAGRHGGKVPLYSRLFAQWMHYAFPNECPYPRSLLTSEAQLNSKEWRAARGVSASATRQEMQAAVEQAQMSQDETVEKSVMLWSEDEELLSDLLAPVSARSTIFTVLRWVAGVAALIASASAFRDAVRQGRSDKPSKPSAQPWFGRTTEAVESKSHFV